jgi:hypothetical protein
VSPAVVGTENRSVHLLEGGRGGADVGIVGLGPRVLLRGKVEGKNLTRFRLQTTFQNKHLVSGAPACQIVRLVTRAVKWSDVKVGIPWEIIPTDGFVCDKSGVRRTPRVTMTLSAWLLIYSSSRSSRRRKSLL